MCGISAVISLSPKPLDPAITGSRNANDSASAASSPLNKSLDAIEHRGPDARKTWLSGDGRVALGHVRLAINDLSTDGEQPFHSSNGEVHAVVNGELYDADIIGERLIKESGAQFKGNSDCEIVIALYETHGLSFVEHLRGEFAICLYDSRLKIFIAARDRYGIKPLYFTEINGQLLVAAEMKAFEPLGWKPEWDVNSMKERGWSHDQRTMFLGVKKIRPGCYFTCDATGHLDHQPYWDLSYPDKHVVDMRSEEEIIAGVRERLLEAVRVRLRADVPVGVFLSGGIDSSIVAGMVKHLMMEKGEQSGNVEQLENIHCYSIGFDGNSGFDESEIAKRTAESLGVQFHKTSITEQALADNFEAATWHCEQALPDLNFVGKYILSDAPRAHGVKVVLTGEGADEHFIGYPAFLPDFLAETDHSWPGNNLPESDREALWQQAKKGSQHMFAVKEADKGTTLASRQVNNVTTIFTMGASANHIFRPWTNQFGECHHQQAIANNVNGIARSLMANSWHPVHTAEYLWTKGYLGNAILTSLADRVEMAHSLEARPPFLDHHLTEYANQLPPSVKMRYNPESRKCTEKWILREAGKPFITQELYERRKHPFSAPPSWPVGGPLHKLMAKLVNRENIEQLGYIEWDVVKDEVRKAFEEKDASSFRMTILLAQYIVLGQKFRVKQATPV